MIKTWWSGLDNFYVYDCGYWNLIFFMIFYVVVVEIIIFIGILGFIDKI
jgi:hypothetical protein